MNGMWLRKDANTLGGEYTLATVSTRVSSGISVSTKVNVRDRTAPSFCFVPVIHSLKRSTIATPKPSSLPLSFYGQLFSGIVDNIIVKNSNLKGFMALTALLKLAMDNLSPASLFMASKPPYAARLMAASPPRTLWNLAQTRTTANDQWFDAPRSDHRRHQAPEQFAGYHPPPSGGDLRIPIETKVDPVNPDFPKAELVSIQLIIVSTSSSSSDASGATASSNISGSGKIKFPSCYSSSSSASSLPPNRLVCLSWTSKAASVSDFQNNTLQRYKLASGNHSQRNVNEWIGVCGERARRELRTAY